MYNKQIKSIIYMLIILYYNVQSQKMYVQKNKNTTITIQCIKNKS